MMTIRNEFDANIRAIEQYIVMLDNNQAVSANDLRLMKASVYLQLYNLMESNVSKLLNHIHNKIKAEQICFDQLSPKMKLVLFNHLSGLIKREDVDRTFALIIDNHRYTNLGDYERRKYYGYQWSGNIDKESICAIFATVGLKLRLHPKYDCLKSIKDRRNWLAHGNKTFNEVGRDTLPSDLRIYTVAVKGAYHYLFAKVDDFCSNKRYKVISPP